MQRKRSSKDMIADSLIDLLSSASFENVTVKQITDNCGIAKGTFYHNFRDKYDLALWCYTRQVKKYFEQDSALQSFSGLMRFTADVLWENRFLIRNIREYKGQNNFRRSLAAPLAEMYLRIIENVFCDEITEDIRTATEFFAAGTITYAESALDKSDIPRPEAAARVFALGVPSGLVKYLDPPRK